MTDRDLPADLEDHLELVPELEPQLEPEPDPVPEPDPMISFIVLGPDDPEGNRPVLRAGSCKRSDLGLQVNAAGEEVLDCDEAQIEALWAGDGPSEEAPDQLRPARFDPRTGQPLPPRFGVDPERQALRQAEEAQAYLDATDWYVIRSIERRIAVPEDITTARAAALAAIEAAETSMTRDK